MAQQGTPGIDFPKQEPDTVITASRGGTSLVQFLWALTLFLVIVALLPGRVGLAVGTLVALGAVLLAPALPQFIETVVRGG